MTNAEEKAAEAITVKRKSELTQVVRAVVVAAIKQYPNIKFSSVNCINVFDDRWRCNIYHKGDQILNNSKIIHSFFFKFHPKEGIYGEIDTPDGLKSDLQTYFASVNGRETHK